ncbi:MAG: ATP-binding cassette domain-containing protein [Actinobacteria bacterium]|nr:ATP-binding cassette domain-containing protein [Actinomycetota bacterium]
MIVLQGVTKRYDDLLALDDVTLAIGRGEFAFLVGTNGAGKTTLIKLLIREERADRGVILLGGVDVTAVSGAALTRLRRRIGVVFQDTRLLPNATVAENVALPLQVRGGDAASVDAAVRDVLQRVGLADLGERRPRHLSGGELRKAAIARAVVGRPDVLLCDEPTESLSPDKGREIVELLLRFNGDGVTTLVATHDRDIVDHLRRRVIHMHAGRISSDAPVGVFDAP